MHKYMLIPFHSHSYTKVVLTYISALVGFLRKIVPSVQRYEQDKLLRMSHYSKDEQGYRNYLTL
jgi:isocitrate dehydrogenase kinase/phosphatase